MFGSLGNLFAAMKRLASAVNHSAELFEAANGSLEERLAIDKSEDRADTESNGRSRKRLLPVK
jgi:hypothetical protein